MEKNQMVLEIPYGTRDFLPKEAAAKRLVEQKLAGLFAAWGYEEVVTPTVEYLDTLTMGNGRALEPHMFKLFDRGNRTLALHHEMTTPIARLAASRLKEFSLCLGQVEFVAGIMEQNGLSEEMQENLKSAMERHDIVGLEELVDSLKLQKSAADGLKEIPLLHGDEAVLQRAYAMALNERSRRALDNLSEIYRLLKSYGLVSHVTFDLGMIRDFNYYTGMVFEAYTPGLGFPLCGGGRYDHMLSDFGMACPATGFAVGIERVLLAMERQKLKEPTAAKDIYLGYAPQNMEEAIQKAMELRRQGKVVELALAAQSEAEAEAAQREKGYDRLEYLA